MIRSSSSSSMSYVSGLSDELLVEILCKLGSSKYATRCKCICKRWFALINTDPSSDSYFLWRWRQIHHKEELALLTQYYYKGYKPHLFYHSKSNDVKPLTYLPGLVFDGDMARNRFCIVSAFKDLVLCTLRVNDEHKKYYICNLITRQWTPLPPPPDSKTSRVSVGLVVVEDPYAPIFKVVRVSRISKQLNVEIYSSDDGEWRQMMTLRNEWRLDDVHSRLLPYKGMMVWWNIIGGVFGVKINPQDAIADRCFNVLLPVGFQSDHVDSVIGLCRGCLRIVQLVYPPSSESDYGRNISCSMKLVIWELNSDTWSWKLVHEFDFLDHDPNMKFKVSLMEFHPTDGELLYLQFVPPYSESYYEENSRFFLYNIRKRTLELVGELPVGHIPSCGGCPLELPFWPTPVPPLYHTDPSKGRRRG